MFEIEKYILHLMFHRYEHLDIKIILFRSFYHIINFINFALEMIEISHLKQKKKFPFFKMDTSSKRCV